MPVQGDYEMTVTFSEDGQAVAIQKDGADSAAVGPARAAKLSAQTCKIARNPLR